MLFVHTGHAFHHIEFTTPILQMNVRVNDGSITCRMTLIHIKRSFILKHLIKEVSFRRSISEDPVNFSSMKRIEHFCVIFWASQVFNHVEL